MCNLIWLKVEEERMLTIQVVVGLRYEKEDN